MPPLSTQPSHQSPRGVEVPAILYGTAWKKHKTAGFVEQALASGFRGIDTACQPKHYFEAGVGVGVRACLSSSLQREDIYLQTKFTPLAGQDRRNLPYDPHASLAEQVQQSCRASLTNLETSYLDALLLHSPLKPLARTLQAWTAFEALVEAGTVKELGISNCYDLRFLEDLWQKARVKPFIVQNRFYAETGYDRTLREWCLQHGLLYQSFWTLSANGHVLAHPKLQALAQTYRATPAQVLFRFLTQQGAVPLTGTTSTEHMRQALSIFDFELSRPELERVDALLL